MKHLSPGDQRCRRLWLIAGTGEGPILAGALRQRGWRLQVSVVSETAGRPYLGDPGVQVEVGALGGPGAIAAELERARRGSDPFAWVIDASHPFAVRISAALAAACRSQAQPLLRLERPLDPQGTAKVLGDLEELHSHHSPGEALLLAIGARRLADAARLAPSARIHARILPTAEALALALAAGLPPERIACLRPGDGRIEAALCRRWGIQVVLCRRSGGSTEALWRRTAAEQGMRLLLLDRPGEPEGVRALTLEPLLAAVGHPLASSSSGEGASRR